MEEPNPDRHHIFLAFDPAQRFYEAMLEDVSINEELRAELRPPRQSHGGTWIIDKVPD